MIENNFTVSLRDYQKSAVSDVCNAIDNNVNSIVQLPTGTGKTTVIAEVIKNWRNGTGKNKRALIVAHRVELIDQIIDRLKTFGILAGKIKAGEPINANYQVQVGLIQSLRNDKRKPVSLGLIVVDEAHHITATSYTKLIDYYKNYSPVVIGFTATPSRLDGAALGSIFKKLFEYGQINKFIDSGYLSPLKHYATGSPNLKSIKIKSTGDYDEKALQQEMSRDLIMANLIEGYETYAMGKKMIVFAVNTYHSKLIAERYNERGYNAIALDYTTDSITRKNIINDFKSGTINILCNVNLFTEGFDCPDVEVVQLARPTKSLNLYLQMVGRGMRIYPGKEHGIILDNAKLWEEHGLTTRERLWTLNGLEKDERKIQIKITADFEKREKDTNIPQESENLALIEVIDIYDKSGTQSTVDYEKNRGTEQKINNQFYRLGKIASELNCSVLLLADKLRENGFDIEAKPTSKINRIMYDFLLNAFSKNKNIKNTVEIISNNNGIIYRMSKVGSELNRSYEILANFLSERGFEVEAKPTSKITEEMYQLLIKEFTYRKTVPEGLDESITQPIKNKGIGEYRLAKVSSELNRSYIVLSETLRSHGYEVEAKLTAKITEPMYNILLQEFATIKNAKIEANKLKSKRKRKRK
jgi:superfamily II DNA or RNA helicase